MKIGLHIPDFTWPNGPERLGPDLAEVVSAAEAAGFNRISLMDHFWQVQAIGGPELDMLEAYTALGYIAAHTSRVKLLALVTGVVFREPGLLAKMVTTLDVLSGGRAILGIGAAWREDEARGLGLPFPPTAERFERLEEALQICLRMWSGKQDPYVGEHYRLDRTLNSPQPLSSPHPPILIGGSGEQKTLRLAAKYAQAWNLFPPTDAARKLDVLRAHCEREGTDFDAIEKSVVYHFDVGADGEKADEVIDQLRGLAELGFDVAHGMVLNVSRITPLEIMGARVIPAVAGL